MRSQPPYASFYFDCDSTLSAIEGVDELARKLSEDERAELLALTHKAMDGELPLAKVYEERLHVLAPSRVELEVVGRFYVEHMVPDGILTIAALKFLGKQVGVVSGGLRQPVLHFAALLGVPEANVHAVPIVFDADGSFVDFDRSSPLWRNQGKVRVMEAVPDSHRPVVFVGDGVTDLEAAGAVDLFIGFGGFERRKKVEAGADVYVTEPSLAAILPVALTEAEKNALHAEPRFADLLGGG